MKLHIHIGFVGNHSITGAICDLVYFKGLNPSIIEITLDKIHPAVDIHYELEEAKKIFHKQNYNIVLLPFSNDDLKTNTHDTKPLKTKY